MDLWIIFLTGLTVGGLTCLAVQGGLLASVIAARSKDQLDNSDNKNTWFPTLVFLVSKLLAYTVLGFILGAFGGIIGISERAQVIMQFVAGLYMVIIALNLLNVHPIFRYAIIQPPRFLTRKLKDQSKSQKIFAPALLGAMTIFIPCGTTLAMEALAISSANAFAGAAILAVFVLGTAPLFFGLGWLTAILGNSFKNPFLKFAAFAVLFLGITSMNGALIASGSPISLPQFEVNLGNQQSQVVDTQVSQNTEINITSHGYSPSYIRIRKDQPATLILKSQDVFSCASAFRIPSLGISRNLQPNDIQTIAFTPRQLGKIQFTCSMGMYSGIIEVI